MHRYGLLLLLLVSGCASRLNNVWYSTTIDTTGASGSFIETRRGVRIGYESSPGVFLPGWTTDSLYYSGGMWRAKRTRDYVMVNLFDGNNDGRADGSRHDLVYDLRLVHDATGGIFWVRSVPVSSVFGRRDLDVVLFDYLDDIRSDVFHGVGFDKHAGTVVRTSRLDDNSVVVSGMVGHAATVDIIDTERVRIDPNAREARARFIVARTPYTDSGGTDVEPGPYPVLLVIGYWNRADRYEAGLADFETLVRRISMQGSTSPDAYVGILPHVRDAAVPPPPDSTLLEF